jgi:two-component system, chemotaxis family, chemotaxis protein CheY
MFDAKEQKVVLTTLSQRRSWLLKQLENSALEVNTREEHIATLRVIDSVIQKLAIKPTSLKPPVAVQAAPVARKSTSKPSVEPGDAYVLIAEDSPESAELLRGILEDMGIGHIEIVKDGRAALYALQNCSPPYDIVLCDWDMPEMTGIEVRKAVKNLAKLQYTHFMMVTAITEATRIREAIGQGISDYIVKPIDIDLLEKKLRLALSGASDANASKQQ